MGPTECKWCGAGAEKVISPRPNEIYFSCFTYYDILVDDWSQDEVCVDRIVAQAKTLREQIRQALAVLKSAKRYDVEPYEDSVSHNYHDVGQHVNADCVDQVIQILEGKRDDETK